MIYGDINPIRQFRSAPVKLVVTLTIAALTFLMFQIIGHHETVATNIIPNLSFEEGGKYWFRSQTSVSLLNKPLPIIEMKLATPPTPLVLGRSIPTPQRYTHIRVGADIKLDNVAPGALWWEQAGIILRSQDKKNQKIRFWPNKAVLLSGTRDWARYETIIPVPDDARHMQLVVFLGGHSGVIQVTNISLDAVSPSAWFQIAKYILIAAWLLIGLWIFAPLLYSAPRKIVALLALFTFLATLVTVLTPQPTLSTTTAHTSKTSVALL